MTEFDDTALFFQALEDGRFEEAEVIWKKSYDLLDSTNCLDAFWPNNNGIYLFVKQAQFAQARKLGQENLTLASIAGNVEFQHIALHQLAYVEREAKQYQLALSYIEEEKSVISQLDLSPEESRLAHSIAGYEYAYLHFLLGDKEIAEKEMQIALELALQTDDEVAKACAYRGLGEILADKSYLQKAKAIFSELNDEYGVREIDEIMENLV